MKVTIRVHYPAGEGEVVLFSERDWDHAVRAGRRSRDGTRSDFDLEVEEPFLCFKPGLVRGGETRLAQGENHLAFPGDRPRDLHPFFFEDLHCSTCEPVVVASGDGSRAHTIRVFEPPGYGENTLCRYPVIYMQDGQNLFFEEEAFNGRPWRIDETLKVLDAMSLARKAIVVGIQPRDRMADYTMPGYGAYGRFLVEDLKPWIDRTRRTLPGPRDTAAMGSSLGGVVSFHLAWTHPEVFGNAICLSSTFGWQDDLFERVAKEPRRRVRFYLDSGWPRDNFEVTLRMRRLLEARGYRSGRDLFYLAFPHARHDEAAWSMRAHIPVQQLLAPRVA